MMLRAGVIAAALAQSAAPAPFAPPIDQPIKVVVSETRDADGNVSVALVEQRVVFSSKTGGGLTAEVVTLPQPPKTATAGDRVGKIALSALAGKRLSITLDQQGRATDVADHDSLWGLVVEGIARDLAAQKRGPASRAESEKLLTPLRAMPAQQKVAMLASCLEPIVGTQTLAIGEREPHDVSMTLRSPDGVSLALTGTERSYRDDAGLLVVERQLSGKNGDRRVNLSETKRADPATGLYRHTRLQVDWWAAGGHFQQVKTAETAAE